MVCTSDKTPFGFQNIGGGIGWSNWLLCPVTSQACIDMNSVKYKIN